MTREQFDKLVRKIEQEYAGRPAALRLRVGLLALLGYVVLLFGFLLVVLLATAFLLVIPWADTEGKIVCGIAGTFILIGGGFAMLRAVLVKVPPPEGVPVQPADAPALFSLLDDLGRQLNCVPFHRVRLICRHNAAVVQVPRLGVLGWCTNYLLIGLPMLDGHPTAEIRAILAHEFAHLSKRDGRFSHWIYRLRRSWEVLFQDKGRARLRGEISVRPLLMKCIELFWPRFNAHAFVLSRANEYQADATAARVAGAEHIASSLGRGALQDRLLEDDFWPDLWRKANDAATPPEGVFSRLREALVQPMPADKRATWFAEAMRIPTTNADTHPCLSERLGALKVSRETVLNVQSERPKTSAADELLGANLPRFRSEVEGLWRKDVEKTWKERHARSGALSHRLSSLENAVPNAAADVDALWDKARVLLDLKGDEEAEPFLRQILCHRPKHVPANFHLGRILLDKGSSDGEAHVEQVIAEEQEFLPQACSLLLAHYRRAGRLDRFREIELRLDRYEKDLAASRAERSDVTARDPLIPHDLAPQEFDALRQALCAEPDLANAWLARKKLQYFPNEKLFLLCIRRKRPWWKFPSAAADQALVGKLTQKIQLPGRVLILTRGGGFRAIAKRVEGMTQAGIV